jgi:outer membrane protein TolC
MGPLLAAAVLAGGCATVRRAREAQRGEGARPGEVTPTAAEMGISSNTVLSLDRAMAVALACHPAVAQATQALAAASAEVRMARADYWPKADAAAGYARSTANTEGQPSSQSSKGAYSASAHPVEGS